MTTFENVCGIAHAHVCREDNNHHTSLVLKKGRQLKNEKKNEKKKKIKNDDLKNKHEPIACTHSAPHPLCGIFIIRFEQPKIITKTKT